MRSGILRGSVRIVPAAIEGGKITGAVAAGSGPSNLYGSVHELGGSRSYQIMSVKARALHFISNGKEVFRKKRDSPASYSTLRSCNHLSAKNQKISGLRSKSRCAKQSTKSEARVSLRPWSRYL